ncbi:MAG: hypothetical protein ACNI25_14500 [Halarcobacter sp.]
MSDSFYEAREPYKDAFEEIYTKAKDEKVSMSTAKDFLNSLSKDELSTLQHYTLLVNDIDVNSLSDEGAYNLLLHHYEKYDFDNDGFVQNGEGKMGELIPKNIPYEEKKAFINTLNQMDEKSRFMAMAMSFSLKINIEGITTKSNNEEVYNYESIMARFDRILNPLPGEYRSEELLNLFRTFKDQFDKNYDEVLYQKEKINSDVDSSAFLSKAMVNTKL